MNYDKKHGWMIPAIDEEFVVLNDNVPTQKVQCLECPDEDNCDKCVFDVDICRGCDVNMTPFLCHYEQRPDGKTVYFKLIETY